MFSSRSWNRLRHIIYMAMVLVGGVLAITKAMYDDPVTPASWALTVGGLFMFCHERLVKCENMIGAREK